MGGPQKHFPYSRVIQCDGCGRTFRPLNAKSRCCTVACKIASNTSINPATNCLEWQGYLNPNGYGQTREVGVNRNVLTHRYVYELYFGKITDPEAVVRHKCDNRRCCNLDHLQIGTRADNVADAVARDRHPRGSTNGQSKIIESDVRELKRRRKEGAPLAKLATDYGISVASVSIIINGRGWRHVK